MKKKRRKRTPPVLDDLRTMEEDRLRPLENQLRVEQAMKGVHAAKKIIECTAFLTFEQRRVNAGWLKRWDNR